MIEEALQDTKGEKTITAKLLRIVTGTIYHRMKGEQEPASTEDPSYPPGSELAAPLSERPPQGD